MSPILLGGGIAISAAVAAVVMTRRQKIIQRKDAIVLTVDDSNEIILYNINDLIRQALDDSKTAMTNLRTTITTRDGEFMNMINEQFTSTNESIKSRIQPVHGGFPMSKVYDETVKHADAVFEDRKRELGKYCRNGTRFCNKRMGH
tara:strand:+ start:352 stop:789 length:438 start_codon:yes stop_codon:yes gene_type:complete